MFFAITTVFYVGKKGSFVHGGAIKSGRFPSRLAEPQFTSPFSASFASSSHRGEREKTRSVLLFMDSGIMYVCIVIACDGILYRT